jgi:3-phosphoshikimate 1-carboxyvinyltransferase
VIDPLPIEPFAHPPLATVALPGSKSVTNRALVCAALARGTSRIRGALESDDTTAMVAALKQLGIDVRAEASIGALEVDGAGGVVPSGPVTLDARMSGTTARFLLPMLALGRGRYVLDGHGQLRARPMGDLVAALRALGASITEQGEPGCLPLAVDAEGLTGGPVQLRGDTSSQFLSGLLLAAPCMDRGLTATLTTELVSRPYVDLTRRVMSSFGVPFDDLLTVGPTGYRASDYLVEPDGTAASYFAAAAALTDGEVTISGLGSNAAQRTGELRFIDVLEQMGAKVRWSAESVTVTGVGTLHGGRFDLRDFSDTAPTLAVVAPFADSPVEITGIGFIRRKESDRVGAVVAELRRCGVDATELDDGLLIRPGTPHPAVVQTYQDHRMAMSFAVLGLRTPGISISDPGCVVKTFPKFFDALDDLRRSVEV